MTQVTADSAGSAYVFVQIWLFSGNPVKYTDPDGRINILKILGGGALVVGSAGITFGTVVEDFGTLGIGTADDIPSFLAAGALFAAGRSLIESGLNDNESQYSAGQNLTKRSQAATPSPTPLPPNGNNDENKKFNMRKLSEGEIRTRTGTEVHDVKDTIRNQYSTEMHDAKVGKNFDIYENNGEVIIKGNQTGAELNLKINIESLRVN
jgi:hypothetical protein